MARVIGITQFLPATHTTILTLLRKHLPDSTIRRRRHTSDIAYSQFIDIGKMKGWVGLVGWPLADGLPIWAVHPSGADRAWDRESLPVKDQRSNQRLVACMSLNSRWLESPPQTRKAPVSCWIVVRANCVAVVSDNDCACCRCRKLSAVCWVLAQERPQSQATALSMTTKKQRFALTYLLMRFSTNDRRVFSSFDASVDTTFTSTLELCTELRLHYLYHFGFVYLSRTLRTKIVSLLSRNKQRRRNEGSQNQYVTLLVNMSKLDYPRSPRKLRGLNFLTCT